MYNRFKMTEEYKKAVALKKKIKDNTNNHLKTR